MWLICRSHRREGHGSNVLTALLTAASGIQNCTYRKIITYQTPQSNLPILYWRIHAYAALGGDELMCVWASRHKCVPRRLMAYVSRTFETINCNTLRVNWCNIPLSIILRRSPCCVGLFHVPFSNTFLCILMHTLLHIILAGTIDTMLSGPYIYQRSRHTKLKQYILPYEIIAIKHVPPKIMMSSEHKCKNKNTKISFFGLYYEKFCQFQVTLGFELSCRLPGKRSTMIWVKLTCGHPINKWINKNKSDFLHIARKRCCMTWYCTGHGRRKIK